MKIKAILISILLLFCLPSISTAGASSQEFQTEIDVALTAYWDSNYDQAFSIWKDLAEKGNADSQYYLGHLYLEGRGTLIDLREAAYWFFQAAEQENLAAAIEFYVLKLNGVLTPFTDMTPDYWQELLVQREDEIQNMTSAGGRFDLFTLSRWGMAQFEEATKRGESDQIKLEYLQMMVRNLVAFINDTDVFEATEFIEDIALTSAREEKNKDTEKINFLIEQGIKALFVWIAEHDSLWFQLVAGKDYVDRKSRFYDTERGELFFSKAIRRGHHEAFYQLGRLRLEEGKYDDAIRNIEAAKKIAVDAYGKSHEVVKLYENWVVHSHLYGGYIKKAEEVALEVISPQLIGEDPETYSVELSQIAEALRMQGRYEGALPIIKQAIDIWNTSSLSTETESYFNLLEIYALCLNNLQQYDEAEVYAKRVIDAIPDRYILYGVLGTIYGERGDIGAGKEAIEKLLNLSKNGLGKEHPLRVDHLMQAGEFYFYYGDNRERAILLSEESRRLNEKYSPPLHGSFFPIDHNLALMYASAGNSEKFYAAANRSIETYLAQVEQGVDLSAGGGEGFWDYRFSFEQQLNTILSLSTELTPDLFSKTFRYYQLIKRSSSGQAIAKMASRFGSVEGAISYLIRDQQDLTKQRNKLVGEINKRFGETSNLNGSEKIELLRAEINQFDQRLDITRSKISAEFPRYQDLTRRHPISIVEIQDLLKAEEALIAYLNGSWYGAYEITYVWIVTRDDAVFYVIDHPTYLPTKRVVEEVIPDSAASEAGFQKGDFIRSINRIAVHNTLQISDIIESNSGREIEIEVLRDGLAISLRAVPRKTVIEGEERVLLGVGWEIYTLDEVIQALRTSLIPDGSGGIHPFNVGLAFDLYHSFFAFAERNLVGASHVLVIPDGALGTFPFHLLVTEYPEQLEVASTGGSIALGQRGFVIEGDTGVTDNQGQSAIDPFKDYRDVAWLARKYAITTLPSVTSLGALRKHARTSQADQTFVGFGDPLFQGDSAIAMNIGMENVFPRGTIADVDAIRQLPQLPDTADELLSIAQALGATSDSVYLGSDATEAQVKTMDLSRSKVLAFSTHGLVSGELPGLAEPGLVFTPPEQGTSEDDGILTASEAAQLRLDADWVILSACNTAAGEGNNADGLSTLSSAFFYAGARALLVSHWPVWSDATTTLIKRIFKETKTDPTVGRAEALRRAMLAMIDDKTNPRYAHPQFWAPFVVVGEGGL